MKYFIAVLLSLMFFCCDSNKEHKSVSTMSTFKDSTSYSMGADFGENLKRQKIDVDFDQFMAGLMDGMETEMVKLNQQERREIMTALQKSIREKSKREGNENLSIAEDFLKENKKSADIFETPTGLQYRVIKEGKGDSPKQNDRVKVHYVGKLIDGSEFDSSIKRGQPSEFGLNQVIKGWTEGLQLMKVGSKFEFYIHPKIAYGARARPNIPANSVLNFEVELLEIIEKK